MRQSQRLYFHPEITLRAYDYRNISEQAMSTLKSHHPIIRTSKLSQGADWQTNTHINSSHTDHHNSCMNIAMHKSAWGDLRIGLWTMQSALIQRSSLMPHFKNIITKMDDLVNKAGSLQKGLWSSIRKCSNFAVNKDHSNKK